MSDGEQINRDEAGGLRRSAHARLLGSGLLERAAAEIERKLRRDPANGPLWRRLADVRRMNGDLGEAATCYARATNLEDQPDLNRALAMACAGNPESLARIEEPPVVPFLLADLPLSSATQSSIMRAFSDDSIPARPAVIGMEREARPDRRDACARILPPDLMFDVLAECGGVFERASTELFAQPVALGSTQHVLLNYELGGGHRAHSDSGAPDARGNNRILTVLLYLSVDTESFIGGDTLLFDRVGNGLTRFIPKPGMALAFPSDAIHEVTRMEPVDGFKPARRVVLVLWVSRLDDENH